MAGKRRSHKVRWWLAGVFGTVCAMLLLVPFVRHMIDANRWGRCNTNLKTIGGALWQYEMDHGSLPPAYLADAQGVPLHSWRVLILPYLGCDSLYRQIRLDEPWNSPHNLSLAPLMPAVYRCPADGDAKEAETSYVAVTGPRTLWPGAKCKRLTSVNNRTRTILAVEVADSNISWMEPRDLPIDVVVGTRSNIAYRHPCGGGEELIKGVYSGYKPEAVGYRLVGANCLFADFHVWAVAETVSPKTIRDLLTVKE